MRADGGRRGVSPRSEPIGTPDNQCPAPVLAPIISEMIGEYRDTFAFVELAEPKYSRRNASGLKHAGCGPGR